jgi:hypothetical protein
VTACCPILGCKTQSDQGSLYPVTFSVASSGGVSTQAAEGQGVSGSERIIVVPDEDAIAAINEDVWSLPVPLALSAAPATLKTGRLDLLAALRHSLLP